VPADLPILAFVGHEANQICLGHFQVQLHFSGVGSIQMEGRWELRDAKGALVDITEERTFSTHQDRALRRSTLWMTPLVHACLVVGPTTRSSTTEVMWREDAIAGAASPKTCQAFSARS
jgi:hypothetical protein